MQPHTKMEFLICVFIHSTDRRMDGQRGFLILSGHSVTGDNKHDANCANMLFNGVFNVKSASITIVGQQPVIKFDIFYCVLFIISHINLKIMVYLCKIRYHRFYTY